MANRRTFECPHCGTELPVTAHFCRECGASDESGWDPDDESGFGDQDPAADDDFNYELFIRREFPDQVAPTSGQQRLSFRSIVIVALCVSMVFGLLVSLVQLLP